MNKIDVSWHTHIKESGIPLTGWQHRILPCKGLIYGITQVFKNKFTEYTLK